MKRLLNVLLSSVLVLNTTAIALADDEAATNTAYDTSEVAMAGETMQTDETDSEVKIFTIDDAITYAKENSRTIKSKKMAMDIAEVSLNQAKSSKYYNNKNMDSTAKTARGYTDSAEEYYKKQKEQGVSDEDIALDTTYVGYIASASTLKSMLNFASDDSALQSVYLTNGYYVDTTQVAYDNAKLAYDETIRTIESTVKASFYSYILLVDKINIAKQSVDNATFRYEQYKTKYEYGQSSALDVESYRLAAHNSQNTYNSLVRKKGLALKAFKQVIGCPIEQEVELVGTFSRVDMDETPLSEAITGANNSVNAKLLDNSFAAAQKGMSLVGKLYSYNRFEYKSAKANFDSTELTYRQNKELLPMSAEYYYNTMVGAYESLDYLDAQIANTEIQVEAQRIRCDQGLITTQDYIESVQNLDNMKISLKDAELGAYQSVINYQTAYTTGSFVYALN